MGQRTAHRRAFLYKRESATQPNNLRLQITDFTLDRSFLKRLFHMLHNPQKPFRCQWYFEYFEANREGHRLQPDPSPFKSCHPQSPAGERIEQEKVILVVLKFFTSEAENKAERTIHKLVTSPPHASNLSQNPARPPPSFPRPKSSKIPVKPPFLRQILPSFPVAFPIQKKCASRRRP